MKKEDQNLCLIIQISWLIYFEWYTIYAPEAPGSVQYEIDSDHLVQYEIFLNLQTFYQSKASEELECHN